MSRKSLRHEIVDSLREIIFGLEDSLVSTLGTITGIAVGTHSQYIVILSGLVLLAAEAMSMSAGSYLSSKHAYEAEVAFHHNGDSQTLEPPQPLRGAVVMGVCYLFGGLVPLIPYLLLDVGSAMVPSIVLTATMLFLVGFWAASFTKTSNWRGGIEMTLVSLAAAGIGYAIGRAVSILFGIDVVT